MKSDITTEEDIQKMVLTFYGRVEKDQRLNYIFNDVAQVHWESHLPKMFDFWSNVLFRTGRYRGNPYREHLPLPIQKDDFGIWMKLFVETVTDLFEGETADAAVIIAGNVATMFTKRMEMDGKFDEKPIQYE